MEPSAAQRPPVRRVRFGIKTPPQWTTYEDLVRVWREADHIPAIEHAWLFDHFTTQGDDPTGPCLEGWTLLAALAAQTERLRVGVLVTGNTYRHPAVLAQMAATVDHISGGRLDFGIGAGWNVLEHTSYGIPLYAPAERVRRLGEACEVIHRLWTDDVVDFSGRFYQLREARCNPKPVQWPHPPIVIGGKGEQLMLQVVAKHADEWNLISPTIEEFRHRSAVLDVHCATIGRDPDAIVRSIQLLANMSDLQATRAEVERFVEAGAIHIVLELPLPFSPADLRGLAHHVMW